MGRWDDPEDDRSSVAAGFAKRDEEFRGWPVGLSDKDPTDSSVDKLNSALSKLDEINKQLEDIKRNVRSTSSDIRAVGVTVAIMFLVLTALSLF